MNKQMLTDQLILKLRQIALTAERDFQAAARMGQQDTMTKMEREDARSAMGNGGLIRGQRIRASKARQALASVEAFKPKPLSRRSTVRLGAIVEIEQEDTHLGRTLFLAPAGAGLELTGPGGDGFLSVITPNSPIGRATLGQRVGDNFDITVNGETRSWEITWVA